MLDNVMFSSLTLTSLLMYAILIGIIGFTHAYLRRDKNHRDCINKTAARMREERKKAGDVTRNKMSDTAEAKSSPAASAITAPPSSASSAASSSPPASVNNTTAAPAGLKRGFLLSQEDAADKKKNSSSSGGTAATTTTTTTVAAEQSDAKNVGATKTAEQPKRVDASKATVPPAAPAEAHKAAPTKAKTAPVLAAAAAAGSAAAPSLDDCLDAAWDEITHEEHAFQEALSETLFTHAKEKAGVADKSKKSAISATSATAPAAAAGVGAGPTAVRKTNMAR